MSLIGGYRRRNLLKKLGALTVVVHKLPINPQTAIGVLLSNGRYNFVSDRATETINKFSSGIQQSKHRSLLPYTLRATEINFGRAITTEEVVLSMDEAKLQPMGIIELLNFGIRYPERQIYHSLIGLYANVRINNEKHFLCLNGYPAVAGTVEQRELITMPMPTNNGQWPALVRFLAVDSMTP